MADVVVDSVVIVFVVEAVWVLDVEDVAAVRDSVVREKVQLFVALAELVKDREKNLVVELCDPASSGPKSPPFGPTVKLPYFFPGFRPSTSSTTCPETKPITRNTKSPLESVVAFARSETAARRMESKRSVTRISDPGRSVRSYTPFPFTSMNKLPWTVNVAGC